MPERNLDELGELQKTVMDVLWELDEGSVKEVLEALSGDPPPAYTTILTILQKLTRSGWLTHRSVGRSYIYRPVCSRDEAGHSAIRGFVEKVFGGDRLLALQQLISGGPLDADEVATLQAMIERRRTEGDSDA